MYTLYLRLATPPSASTSPSPTSDHATSHATLTIPKHLTDTDAPVTITLATYDGWNTCMDAPRWTTLAPNSNPNSNSKLVFWESREKVGEVLEFVAGEREQVRLCNMIAMGRALSSRVIC